MCMPYSKSRPLLTDLSRKMHANVPEGGRRSVSLKCFDRSRRLRVHIAFWSHR